MPVEDMVKGAEDRSASVWLLSTMVTGAEDRSARVEVHALTCRQIFCAKVAAFEHKAHTSLMEMARAGPSTRTFLCQEIWHHVQKRFWDSLAQMLS